MYFENVSDSFPETFKTVLLPFAFGVRFVTYIL